MEHQDISYKISQLERELKTPRSRSLAAERNKRMDEMVADLANPSTAEQLRIFKLVEAQFDNLEQQVKEEVSLKLEKQKKEKEFSALPTHVKAEEILKKSAKLRKEQAKKPKVTAYKKSAIPKLVSPRRPVGKVVSFKEKAQQKEEDRNETKFTVLQQKDVNSEMIPIAAPVIVDMSRRGKENQGLFQVRTFLCISRLILCFR